MMKDYVKYELINRMNNISLLKLFFSFLSYYFPFMTEGQRVANVIYKTLLYCVVDDQKRLHKLIRDEWLNHRWKSVTIDIEKNNQSKQFDIQPKSINEDTELIFDFIIRMMTLEPLFYIISTEIGLFKNEALTIPISCLNNKGLETYLCAQDTKKYIFKKIMYSQQCQSIFSDSNMTIKTISFKARYNISIQAHIVFWLFCLSHVKDNERGKRKESRDNIIAYRHALQCGYKRVLNNTQSLGIYTNEKRQILSGLMVFIKQLDRFLIDEKEPSEE